MPEPKKPYTLSRISLWVYYTDEDGEETSMHAEPPTIEMAIEHLGSMERKVERMRKEHQQRIQDFVDKESK